MILLINGEPLGGNGLTGPICPFLFLNPFSPTPAKIGPFVILLCQTILLVRGEPLGGKGLIIMEYVELSLELNWYYLYLSALT